MIRLRWRRRAHAKQSAETATKTTAAIRELLGVKADAQHAMERIAEADRAIDRWTKEHRGTSTA